MYFNVFKPTHEEKKKSEMTLLELAMDALKNVNRIKEGDPKCMYFTVANFKDDYIWLLVKSKSGDFLSITPFRSVCNCIKENRNIIIETYKKMYSFGEDDWKIRVALSRKYRDSNRIERKFVQYGIHSPSCIKTK